MEAVVHGPPAIAGVGVRDAPPARATDVEHVPLRRRRERGDGDECKDEGQRGEEELRLGGGTDHQRRHGPLDDLGFGGPAAVQQDAEEGTPAAVGCSLSRCSGLECNGVRGCVCEAQARAPGVWFYRGRPREAG